MIGVFDRFKIAIGPSSLYTIDPMKAADSFLCGFTISWLGPPMKTIG